MCFGFLIPPDQLPQVEEDYEALMAWIKTKVPNPNRIGVAPPKWDVDKGNLVKVQFGGEHKPDIPFVDTDGNVLDKETRKSIRAGTKVRIICDQKPYAKSNIGTTFKVLGVQVIELVTGNISDSGAMTTEDVVSNVLGGSS